MFVKLVVTLSLNTVLKNKKINQNLNCNPLLFFLNALTVTKTKEKKAILSPLLWLHKELCFSCHMLAVWPDNTR